MLRALRTIAVALVIAFTSTIAGAQSVMVGKTGNVPYKIAVPPSWNGGLVVWNHGFTLKETIFTIDPLNPLADLGPLAALQLSEGYAIAASAYALPGWALFRSDKDVENLVRVFETRIGVPSHVILTGASLGGGVTASALEHADLGNVVGALTVCGATGGSRNWDGGLDLRLIYDAVCSAVPGAFIPGGAEGLPRGFALTSTQLALAINQCTGILAPPAARTPAQQQRLSSILTTAKIPEEFLLTSMGYVTFAMSDLVHDPLKLAGKVGTGNKDVDYNDPTIDATIARVAPTTRAAAGRLARNFTPTGEIGGVRVLSLHTDKDGLVVVENQGEYASLVPAGQFAGAVVVEAIPSHCGFTSAELVGGWESLRGWLATSVKPTAASIQGVCTFAAANGIPGPCRIDPTFVPGTLDTRIRPR